MIKKYYQYQLFADAVSMIKNTKNRNEIMAFLVSIFKNEDKKFKPDIFDETVANLLMKK